MNAVILVIDRLQAGYLGAYGNAWVATPALDRFAAESFVFDQAFLDTADLSLGCRSLWTAGHALQTTPWGVDQSLAGKLALAGVPATLMTDDGCIAGHPLAAAFDEIVRLERSTAKAADAVEQTAMGQFFSATVDWLTHARPPFCLWLHAGSLGFAWDAPREFRERYADDDLIAVPEFVTPPSRALPAGFDPDELLPTRWAYAAQVSVLDLCVGAFLDQLQALGLADSTLIALTSPRGYPLGEHRQVGPPPNTQIEEALHEELVHVPLIVRLPNGFGAASRSQALVQPGDIAATLLDWWRIPVANEPGSARFGQSLLPIVREETEQVRDRLCLGLGPTEYAIRTPAWYLRTSLPGGAIADIRPHVQLYAKPADRWEVNDVHSRCGEVAEELAKIESATRQALVAGQHRDQLPLPEVMIWGNE